MFQHFRGMGVRDAWGGGYMDHQHPRGLMYLPLMGSVLTR